MTLNELIHKAVAGQEMTADDVAELRRLVRDCPASVVAPALLLKCGNTWLDDAEREALRQTVALRGGCIRDVINFIDPSGKDFANFYPPEPVEKRPETLSAIDTFLETYGHQSPEEDALLERMIFNPVPDYAEQLARDDASEGKDGKPDGDWQDQLIDAFLGSHPADGKDPVAQPEVKPEEAPAAEVKAAKPRKAEKEVTPPQNSLLSESLAKIFIKQGHFDRAYEIIRHLSLNYPEKSCYFADQLRFLEKLMINQKYAKRD